MKKIKCEICKAKIDRADCKTAYTIITHIDNNTCPITKKKIYLCQDCYREIYSKILDLKLLRFYWNK